MSKGDPGGATWFLVFAFLASCFYYIFVYPFVWLWRKVAGRPMD